MSTKVVTNKVRFSYLHAFEPQTPQGGGDPKYSATLLIPKSDTDTINKIRAAIAEAREAFCAKNGANALPAKPTNTVHDGDGLRESGEPYGEECRGCYVLTVSSKTKPVVVDSARNPILDATELYSGCYGRACINFYGYSRNGKKGISAGLNSLQKLYDGEPLGGAAGSANDFADGWTDPDAPSAFDDDIL